MSIPYRYVRGAATGRDDTCALCASRSTALVVDHCHTHGLSRGLVCGGCNNRLGRLDSGATVPSPREAFYLSNCPECRRTESLDSPDASALRIGAVALAIATQLSLTPPQAGALALSLLQESESLSPENGTPREAPAKNDGGSREDGDASTLAELARGLLRTGVNNREASARIIERMPSAKPDSVKAAVRRERRALAGTAS
ncbi:endonuclease domain-containing protein [Streptomyces mirabilis]|uniref:endonuclease domain-containing protein n=1 Tax=Streptomyces mirabilis TaxID=68239 RepID=UPI002252FF4E|nr:endonuclease domain-containing protein [Streptomyces mirabilis]MCX4612121.1 endonuclease VII domain-containing protein [Streptomyces mirabilis]